MPRTRLSCAKTYPPLMRQSGDRWHASAPLSESAGRHDGLAFQSCILTKCAGGSTAAAASGDSQQAAAATQYTWKRPLAQPTKKVFGVFENIQCNRPNLQIIRPKCR